MTRLQSSQSCFSMLHYLLLLWWFTAGLSSALILPPADKIRMGMVEELEEECQAATPDDCNFFWEFDVEEEYQLATTVFSRLAECEHGQAAKIWLPSCLNRLGEVDRLMRALNKNSDRLGGLQTTCQHWPEVPASLLEWTWKDDAPPPKFYEKESQSVVDAAVKDTEDYVENKLCKLSLCPYTKSMQRAAIGLESLGVHEGPVGIRHAANVVSSTTTTPAAVMAALFWQGFTELVQRPETEVATLLLVAPSCYDNDFEQYYETCDELIEKSVKLAFGTVGRVWFHPLYNLKQVGYSSGGHTLPVDVVGGYMDEFVATHPDTQYPDPEELARAHDETRKTPHATLNLLRGSQLNAAKDNENRAILYARNVLRILEAEKAGGESFSSSDA